MFDVPLHFSFHDASVAEGEYDLSRLLDGSMMMSNPAKAVTFVENHESQPGGVLESAVAEWFKPLAYAIILLREQGYPCMFMGDYEGIPAAKIKSRKTVMNKLLKLRKKYAYGTQHDYFAFPITSAKWQPANCLPTYIRFVPPVPSDIITARPEFSCSASPSLVKPTTSG